jgi:hypothetical protein
MMAAVRAALVAAAVLLASSAWAGESGIPVGDLVLKPGVRIGFVYDSNVASEATALEPDIGIEVQPYLGIVYSGENFLWDMSLHYRLLKYADLNLPAGRTHSAYSTFTTFGFSSLFDVNRKGKVGFYFAPSVENRLVRTGSEAGDGSPPTAGGQSGSDYKFGVSMPIELRLRPTKAVTLTPKFKYGLDRFYFPSGPFAPNPDVLAQSHLLDGGIAFDWRFFPRSHLLVDLTGGYKHWEDQATSGSALAAQTPAGHFRALAGIRGDITRKLSIMLMAGYGYSFAIGNEALNLAPENGILGSFELGIRPVTTQRLAFGFKREFSNPYYAQWQSDTQGYFKYKGLWFGRLGTQVDFAYIYRDLKAVSGGADRKEHQITAGILLEIMIAEWFHIDASYRFGAIPTTDTNTAEYLDSRVLVGVTFGFK